MNLSDVIVIAFTALVAGPPTATSKHLFQTPIVLNLSQIAARSPSRRAKLGAPGHLTIPASIWLPCPMISSHSVHRDPIVNRPRLVSTMPFASASTLHPLKSRSIPLVTAAVLSTSVYAAYLYTSPARADDTPPTPVDAASKKSRFLLPINTSPYTPLGWGSNKYLTLWPDPTTVGLKRPTPLTQLGSTPLRDLVIAEKYGACVDARGDIWMWGAGYDPSGDIGRSLKGKVGKLGGCPFVADIAEHYHPGPHAGQGAGAKQRRKPIRRVRLEGLPG